MPSDSPSEGLPTPRVWDFQQWRFPLPKTILVWDRGGTGRCWSRDETCSYLSCVIASFLHPSLVFEQKSWFFLFVLPSRKAEDADGSTVGSLISPTSCPVPPPSLMHLEIRNHFVSCEELLYKVLA